MIEVQNLRKYKPTPGKIACYVGRNFNLCEPYKEQIKNYSVLGNPFILKSERLEVVRLYDDYLEEKLKEDQSIKNAMNDLYSLAKSENVILLCHCAPELCHADVIQERLLLLLPKSQNLEEQIERELVLQGYRRHPDGSIEWKEARYKPVGQNRYKINPSVAFEKPYFLPSTETKYLQKLLSIK